MSARRERNYRAVFDALDDGFCVIRLVYDAHGAPVDYVFLETNPAFERHTGFTEPVGRSMRSYVPELESFWYEFYARVLETGVPASTQFHAAAMGRWFDTRASRFGTVEDAEVAILFKDITAQKRAEAAREQLLLSESAARSQAETASRQKDEFLATLSHELRTPLHAMLGWLHMLRGANLSDERRERALVTVERNARLQAQLIEDLLDVSRILFGKLHIDVATTNLTSAVEAALETIRPTVEKKQLALVVELEPSAFVRGDAQRLTQVAWNLLTNAVKFTPPQGQVQVTVARQGALVELTVIDSGQGISAEFLPHVFERFRQQEGGSLRTHAGLGLGLSIVQQLVELHGGTIHVHSAGEGHGARFVVRLPASHGSLPAGEPATLRDEPGSLRPPTLQGIEVLVVDDHADARDVVRELLEQCGAKVRTAASADEALRAFAARPPHLLISDIGMPQRGGHALIHRVRQLELHQGGEVPAIALTAYARREDREQALRAGFTTHVAKPVAPDELLTLIASLVSR
ncbi:MAG TPA: ATP-binding protein [Polyangiales bacterium]|nr:ATP-binding protein [Polyangiales bacterium]